jgi:hypothetical protein
VSNVPYVEDQEEQADDYDSDAEFERAVDAMEEEMENDRGGATIQSEEEIENQMEDETVESDAQPEGIITQFNPDHIITDPGLRIPIDQFHVDIRSDVRRAYIAKGPTQPTGYNFSKTENRRFQEKWFKKHPWLEYSVEKDKAYCFYCYLFKQDRMDEKFGYDAFTTLGFDTWKNAYLALPKHDGRIHNQCRTAYEDFDNQRTSVKHKVRTYTKDAQIKYETRLDTSLGIVSWLTLQGEPFRGHDESFTSLNRGNFREFLEWYKERNEQVKLAFDEACPKNAQMTSPTIQKELAECCAAEVTKAIKEEMSNCLFSVLIDESRDISVKEQMAVVVR